MIQRSPLVLVASLGPIRVGVGQTVIVDIGATVADLQIRNDAKFANVPAGNVTRAAPPGGKPVVKPVDIHAAVPYAVLTDHLAWGLPPVGCVLAAATLFPAFHMLTAAANPALAAAQANAPVTVTANPGECNSQFDPVGSKSYDITGCDIIKAILARSGVNYRNVAAPAGTVASITIGTVAFTAPDPAKVSGEAKKTAIAAFTTAVAGKAATPAKPAEGGKPATAATPPVKGALADVGYPSRADPDQINKPLVVAILFYLVILVTMVYGPIAALLVELFPSRIRYSAMSLPYHIGNGWLGGLLPAISFAMVAANGDIFYGLWYPVVVAAGTAVIGALFLPETYKRRIDG